MRRRVVLAGHRGAPLRHRAPSKSSLALSPRAVSCVWCGVPVSMWRITRQPRYPLRIGASRVAPAPLANRKIAFGCGRLAIRASASRPLSWRARYPPPLARARLRCGAASRSATAQPPLVPRAASIRECGLHGLVGIPPCARMLAHPSGSASPNLPSDASHLRRICNAASRRLPCAGGGLRSGPLACAPPLARCRYMPFLARRKRRRLHRLL